MPSEMLSNRLQMPQRVRELCHAQTKHLKAETRFVHQIAACCLPYLHPCTGGLSGTIIVLYGLPVHQRHSVQHFCVGQCWLTSQNLAHTANELPLQYCSPQAMKRSQVPI